MQILVLGGNGMAGHMITSYLKNKHYNVAYTSRNSSDLTNIYLDAWNEKQVEEVILSMQPHIVINCIGILNERASANPTIAFRVNGELPHQLARLVSQYGGRLVHISTDCVFSGMRGKYTETDLPDGSSVYALSKQQGEVIDNNNITIRTSIIGPELKDDGIGLFLWFMKQHGQIKGYERVLWNGVTTLELAKAIENIIAHNITGLCHLCSAQVISKYELLRLIQMVYDKSDVDIIPCQEIILDRTLRNTRADLPHTVPSYKQMLQELKAWSDEH